MSLSILRWKGGYGGDTLLRLILMSHPGTHTNVVFNNKINNDGSQQLDFSHVVAGNITDLDRMSLNQLVYPVQDYIALSSLLHELEYSKQSWCVKSHCYNFNEFNDITIDIVADVESLPFAVSANLTKGEIDKLPYNQLVSKIKNPEILNKYNTYNLAQDALNSQSGNQYLTISNIISNWQNLCQSLEIFGITLHPTVEIIYQNWATINQQYFPSLLYQQLVRNQEYNFNDARLSMTERYCLLAVSGKQFQLLK
jgi:hypothetical protein